MKAKCYAICEGSREVLSEYANPSQKTFLSYEVATAADRVAGATKVAHHTTSNGVWYGKTSEKTRRTHLVLLSAESATLPAAVSLLSRGIEWEGAGLGGEKLRMRVGEEMRTLNANSRVESLNSNVMDLENMMKGNVSKIINNMSDLDTAERKSERLHELSMHFESDARVLQEKMKKKACLRRLIMLGVGAVIVLCLVYFFIL